MPVGLPAFLCCVFVLTLTHLSSHPSSPASSPILSYRYAQLTRSQKWFFVHLCSRPHPPPLPWPSPAEKGGCPAQHSNPFRGPPPE